MIKIVALSDSHWIFDQIKVPKCDICIHAGDLQIENWSDANNFSKWWNNIEATHKVIVPGNHDLLMEYQNIDNYFKNTWVLINQTLHLPIPFNGKETLDISGTPYTPRFNDWAFMYDEDGKSKHFHCINNSTDLIVSHGPLFGIHDEVYKANGYFDMHVGSLSLKNRIESLTERKPRILIHGHIHQNEGSIRYTHTDNLDIYNVSVVDEDYKYVFKPRLIEI